MKKHNEGYALPFVLVVLVVMCIISVGIMDFCLRNLQSQQNTIQRMEAKYEAAAKIEEIVAAAENDVAVEENDVDGAENDLDGAENDVAAVTFPSSENLLFCVKDGNLRIASASGDLWIIAELKTKNANGVITKAFGDDGKPAKLTVKGSAGNLIEFLTYKVVDQDTAWAYVEYTPKKPDESTPTESSTPSESSASSESAGGDGQ